MTLWEENRIEIGEDVSVVCSISSNRLWHAVLLFFSHTSSLLSLVVMSEEGPHIKSPFVLTPGGLVFCHSLSSIPD